MAPFASNLKLSAERSKIHLHKKCSHSQLGPILIELGILGWVGHYYYQARWLSSFLYQSDALCPHQLPGWPNAL